VVFCNVIHIDRHIEKPFIFERFFLTTNLNPSRGVKVYMFYTCVL
jgi:hypothetical protein